MSGLKTSAQELRYVACDKISKMASSPPIEQRRLMLRRSRLAVDSRGGGFLRRTLPTIQSTLLAPTMEKPESTTEDATKKVFADPPSQALPLLRQWLSLSVRPPVD